MQFILFSLALLLYDLTCMLKFSLIYACTFSFTCSAVMSVLYIVNYNTIISLYHNNLHEIARIFAGTKLLWFTGYNNNNNNLQTCRGCVTLHGCNSKIRILHALYIFSFCTKTLYKSHKLFLVIFNRYLHINNPFISKYWGAVG